MAPMNLVVVGAGGRMGRTLIRLIAAAPESFHLVGAVEAEGSVNLGQDAGALAGLAPLGVPITDDPLPLFAKAEGVLDFTIPAASVAFTRYAAQARIVHVCGSTGFTAEQDAKFEAAGRHAVIIKSGNMSLGVNVFAALVEKAASALDETFDIEIVETHHRHKIDAPSGTALLLGEAAARGRGKTLGELRLPAREGHTGARPKGAIGFAALRGGAVVGEHTVAFLSETERFELTHKAGDRALFASGALKAALWGRGRKPGLFSMRDVLGL